MKKAKILVYGNITSMEILQSLSKNRVYNKMLRVLLFSIFTIKTPWVLHALAPLNL